MKIGFIGLGIMGEAMCANIVKKHGEPVFVNDLDPSRVEKLVSLGASACACNAEVAQKADLIITMVPKSEHLRAVYEEILPSFCPGKIGVDMSTVDPDVSIEIANAVKAKGGQFADAPVVKSRPAAESGTLGIYVGCDEALFETIAPVLFYMGVSVQRMGENGSGLVMKICHNALVAEIQNGVNETLTLAGKFGIDPERFAAAIAAGGGQNFYLDGQWKNLRDRNWSTAFSLQNMHKDLGICRRLAEETGVRMPGMLNAKSVYDKGMEAGLGPEDFRATFKVVSDELDA